MSLENAFHGANLVGISVTWKSYKKELN